MVADRAIGCESSAVRVELGQSGSMVTAARNTIHFRRKHYDAMVSGAKVLPFIPPALIAAQTTAPMKVLIAGRRPAPPFDVDRLMLIIETPNHPGSSTSNAP